MFCNTFLRHLDVMMAIYLLLMKIQRFWYYAEYDGSKTYWFSQILKVSFCYHVKYDCSKTSDEITSATSYFWYHVKHDGSKTSQHVYIKIIVFQKILKTLLYD